MQSSLDLFSKPEHLSRDKLFFCNYCSSLQPGIIEHGFYGVGQFFIIKLKRFVNLKETVTKDINIVECFANKSSPVILDNDIVKQRKVTLISRINHSVNLNNGH